jgi:hypothetical protein
MFVIVNPETHRAYIKRGSYSPMVYETESAAKAGCTRQFKKTGVVYEPMVDEAYQILKSMTTKMVEKTNLMSGLKYMEAEDTPNFMSPSCEAYWSM